MRLLQKRMHDWCMVWKTASACVASVCIVWLHVLPIRNPNHREGGHDLVTWPKFTSSEEAYLNIALEPSVMYKLHPERMAFWNDFIPKLMDYEPKAEEKETKNKKKDELWETRKQSLHNQDPVSRNGWHKTITIIFL